MPWGLFRKHVPCDLELGSWLLTQFFEPNSVDAD